LRGYQQRFGARGYRIAVGLSVGPWRNKQTDRSGPATRIVDLKKRSAIPGITDGHAHMDRERLRHFFPSLTLEVSSPHD
jgi:predicted amidohydrolase YtcJ